MVEQDHQKLSVAALIVTYNRKALLRQCLEALRAQTRPPDETIVVDNASSDGTAEMLTQEFPWVTCIYSPENTGSAGGMAQALKAAYDRGHDLFWCMDDDCWPMGSEALAILLDRITKSDVTLVAPLMHDRSRGEVRKGGMWSGGLMRRELVAVVGLPNPALFTRYADGEYSHRIARHGLKVANIRDPQCAVWHSFGPRKTSSMRLRGAGSAEPAWRTYYQVRNPIYVDLRSGFPRRALRPIMVAVGMLACSMFARQRLPRAWYVLKGIWDGIWGRMGRRVEPHY